MLVGKTIMSLDILILCQTQLGYHLDTYFYCKYLSKTHTVHYVCWDYCKEKQDIEGVNTLYVTRNGNILIRNLRYIITSINFLKSNKISICFIKYFRGCSILRVLFPKVKFVFDIRTGSVSNKYIHRFFYDSMMKFESKFFQNITIVSDSLAKKLSLRRKAKILPLGSISFNKNTKSLKSLDLIYVGTLHNRQIEKSVEGFRKFLNARGTSDNCMYTIIGSGPKNEVEYLQSLVEEYDLSKSVKILGQIPFLDLHKYFHKANIGVSFIPMTPFFDVQPATKTYDYMLSGLVVIATKTYENTLVINESNGVLIDDSAEAFCKGLNQILARKDSYCTEKIRENAKIYHWDSVTKDLENYLTQWAIK